MKMNLKVNDKNKFITRFDSIFALTNLNRKFKKAYQLKI